MLLWTSKVNKIILDEFLNAMIKASLNCIYLQIIPIDNMIKCSNVCLDLYCIHWNQVMIKDDTLNSWYSKEC